MSAPDPANGIAHARHYFADYETYHDGHAVAWGQVTHSICHNAGITPADVLSALRERAAREQGVDAGAIRLRCICRL